MAQPENDKSLGDLHPELVAEWNKEKNGALSPYEVNRWSKKKVWWKCNKCGFEWETTIGSRTRGSGCPACWEKRRSEAQSRAPREKSLAALYPEVAEEWNYEKNGDITPDSVYPKSNKKVWWKCKLEHEWKANIASRTNGAGCPICRGEVHTSFPEQALFWYLVRDYNGEVFNREQLKIDGNKYEIDIFIPEKQVGVEYDGLYWHRNAEQRDEKKTKALEKQGIQLIRVKEGQVNNISDNIIEYNFVKDRDSNLNWAIESVEMLLGINARGCIDARLHNADILELYKSERLKNSLAEKQPDIAKEWNYLRNGTLTPQMFSSYSSHKVWWTCKKCGHEWQATISNRAAGHGCPECAKKAVAAARTLAKEGESFGDKHPELLKEWDYEKNRELSPFNMNEQSQRKVWWKCSTCGFSWQASLAKRSIGRGCPYCSKRTVIAGNNDFTVSNPELLKEWDFDKNNGIDPQSFAVKSHKRVWWKCIECGHEWQAQIVDRTAGHGCPKCAKRRTAEKLSTPPTGKSLADLYPELTEEWNYEKNGDITPQLVFPKSQKKVWWKCKRCGYEWQAAVSSRVGGTNCPPCSGHIVAGINDFTTKKPELLEEWNYEKNEALVPQSFGVQSHKKVWWKCKECGFEWEASIQNRGFGYCKCPNCKGSKK